MSCDKKVVEVVKVLEVVDDIDDWLKAKGERLRAKGKGLKAKGERGDPFLFFVPKNGNGSRGEIEEK